MIRLSLHRSQYPAIVRRRLEAALARRELPGRFLYDSPAQAGRWLAYHQAFSPSRTDDDVEALYDRAFAAAARAPNARDRLVSLGSGGGRKDRRLLAALGGRAVYMPIDTSPSLVAESTLTASDRAARVDPWVMDLDAELSGDDFGSAESGRLFAAFGMIPNFELEHFGPRLSSWLGEADRLLLSFNLSPGPLWAARERVLPQYDNPEGRAWLLGGLAELGLPPSHLRLDVDAASLRPDGEEWRIEAWVEITRALEVALPWGVQTWDAGDRLRAFISNRLTPAAAESRIEAWGLSTIDRFVAGSGEEGVWLCRRTV